MIISTSAGWNRLNETRAVETASKAAFVFSNLRKWKTQAKRCMNGIVWVDCGYLRNTLMIPFSHSRSDMFLYKVQGLSKESNLQSATHPVFFPSIRGHSPLSLFSHIQHIQPSSHPSEFISSIQTPSMHISNPKLLLALLAPCFTAVQALGINCDGSSNCAGNIGGLSEILSSLQNISPGNYYSSGQHIACARNICCFYQVSKHFAYSP